VRIDASVKPMGGQGVSQGVETRAEFDARPSSGWVVKLLGGATGHGLIGLRAGEEPGPWARDLPLGAPLDKHAIGTQAVAVLVAFAWVETDEQAARIALHLRALQPDPLADAQAGGIRGHQ
jgi:hypothetical protein